MAPFSPPRCLDREKMGLVVSLPSWQQLLALVVDLSRLLERCFGFVALSMVDNCFNVGFGGWVTVGRQRRIPARNHYCS